MGRLALDARLGGVILKDAPVCPLAYPFLPTASSVMPVNTKEFIDTLITSGLMTAEEIEAVQQSLPSEEQGVDLMALARELVKRRKLTKYQAGRIYQGKSNGLVVGNYVLLDKIGEGGMGEVFKAEHRRMKRVVAIKTLTATLTDSVEPLVAVKWPRNFFASIKITDRAFDRPTQGDLPPVVDLGA